MTLSRGSNCSNSVLNFLFDGNFIRDRFKVQLIFIQGLLDRFAKVKIINGCDLREGYPKLRSYMTIWLNMTLFYLAANACPESSFQTNCSLKSE